MWPISFRGHITPLPCSYIDLTFGAQQTEAYKDSEYELVTLHPNHLLPYRSTLNIHDDNNKETLTTYAPSKSENHRLRASPDDKASTDFSSFKYRSIRGDDTKNLDVFLVILNGYTKFRQFFGNILLYAMKPLEDDILRLTTGTIELVELLY